VGGTVEESANSQASVFAKVPLMLFLMLLFLMAQLHSFSRLILVLCIVPMGLIGIVAQIETERAGGRDTWDAVVQGTVSRFRPIMLTAISTVLGFIPIAPTVFWGPMAFAIMGGLFVATMLTLIVLPALYVAWFGIKEPEREAAV
jgi:multidrug efflux pump subunit AcrB